MACLTFEENHRHHHHTICFIPNLIVCWSTISMQALHSHSKLRWANKFVHRIHSSHWSYITSHLPSGDKVNPVRTGQAPFFSNDTACNLSTQERYQTYRSFNINRIWYWKKDYSIEFDDIVMSGDLVPFIRFAKSCLHPSSLIINFSLFFLLGT